MERINSKGNAAITTLILWGVIFLSLAGVKQILAATLTIGQGSGTAGATGITIPISLQSAPGERPSSLQMDVEFDPESLKVVEVIAGHAAMGAGKEVVFNTLSPGKIRFIVAGLNQNMIGDGEVALLRVEVSPSVSGKDMVLKAVSPLISDPEGKEISASGVDGVVKVSLRE